VRIDVFTIFPALVDAFSRESLLGRARAVGLLDLRCHDLREHATDELRPVPPCLQPLRWRSWVPAVVQPKREFASVSPDLHGFAECHAAGQFPGRSEQSEVGEGRVVHFVFEEYWLVPK
jgi:hypothetical protein